MFVCGMAVVALSRALPRARSAARRRSSSSRSSRSCSGRWCCRASTSTRPRSRSARSRLSSGTATGSAPALLGARRGDEDLPRPAAPARARVDVAAARPARGARLRRDLRSPSSRWSSCRSPCSSPDGMRWSLARQLTRPLQIETLGSAILLAAHQAFGLAITMKGEPRLAEPRRDAAERARGVPDRAPGRSRSSPSGSRSRAARRRPRAARALLGRGGLRVRRAREGALAAVPDLARARSSRSSAGGAALVAAALLVARAGADAALVPVPLLGPRAPLRRLRVVARARARPRAGRAARRADRCPAAQTLEANRLARRSAAVGVAADERALEPDAALGRLEAHAASPSACGGSRARP